LQRHTANWFTTTGGGCSGLQRHTANVTRQTGSQPPEEAAASATSLTVTANTAKFRSETAPADAQRQLTEAHSRVVAVIAASPLDAHREHGKLVHNHRSRLQRAACCSVSHLFDGHREHGETAVAATTEAAVATTTTTTTTTTTAAAAAAAAEVAADEELLMNDTLTTQSEEVSARHTTLRAIDDTLLCLLATVCSPR
jgi:hypothetical protein